MLAVGKNAGVGVVAPGDITWTIGGILGIPDLLEGSDSKLLLPFVSFVSDSSLSLSSLSSSSDSGIDFKLDFLETFLEIDSFVVEN